MMKVVLILVCACLHLANVHGLICQACKRARSLEQCSQITHCTPGQECFVDEVIDASGISYNAGCRATEICTERFNFPGIGKRDARTSPKSLDKRQSALVACSRCCNHDVNLTSTDVKPCNTRLCGLPREIATDHLTCYFCDKVNNFEEDCNEVTTCPNNKVCSSKTESSLTGTRTYTFGCLEKTRCIAFTKKVLALHDLEEKRNHTHSIKRSDVTLCNICCGGSYCNTGDCVDLEKKLHELAKYNNLNLDTLEYV